MSGCAPSRWIPRPTSSASGEALICSGSRSGRAGPRQALRGVPPRLEARSELAGSRGQKTEGGGQRSPAGRREAAGGSSERERGRWTPEDRQVAGGGSSGPSGGANAGGGKGVVVVSRSNSWLPLSTWDPPRAVSLTIARPPPLVWVNSAGFQGSYTSGSRLFRSVPLASWSRVTERWAEAGARCGRCPHCPWRGLRLRSRLCTGWWAGICLKRPRIL